MLSDSYRCPGRYKLTLVLDYFCKCDDRHSLGQVNISFGVWVIYVLFIFYAMLDTALRKMGAP